MEDSLTEKPTAGTPLQTLQALATTLIYAVFGDVGVLLYFYEGNWLITPGTHNDLDLGGTMDRHRHFYISATGSFG